MNNAEILRERWKNTDEYLLKYLKKYKIINRNTRDNIQNVFNELNIDYKDINKNISKQQKNKLDRFILNLKKNKLLKDYFGYKARLIFSKKSVTYLEMLEIMIMACYIQQNEDLKEYNNLLFYEVCKESYEQGIKDIEKIKKIKPISFKLPILYTILNIPIFNATAESYLYSLALTNAEETFKQVLINMQLNRELNVDNKYFENLFNKQDNRFININKDKASGGVVNIVENVTNLAYLQSGIDTNTTECRFIAEMDKRTTKMCESLNNQVFKINEMNIYQRYSDADKKIITYHTQGLVRGENLPPIDNHFHWCRSTITYLLEENIADVVRDNIKVANNTDKEQYDRYKKYFEEMFEVEDVEKFCKMKYNNSDEWNYLKQNYIYAKHRYKAIQDKKLDSNISVRDYINKVHEIRQELLDYKLYNGKFVKDITLHFYDRVIGNPEEKRIGVSIANIKDTLSNVVEIRERENGSVLIIGKNAKVSYNPTKIRLINTIPGGKK